MFNHKSTIGFLFDLDGVLIDSESEYTAIWKRINEEFPTGVDNMELLIKGCTLSKILDDYYPDEKTRFSVKERLHELEGLMKYRFLPGAKDFLIFLKDNNFPMALVTSSDCNKMSHLREELPEIFTFFDYIVTGDKVKNSKPDPEGYLLGAQNIKVLPHKCVVFEDSLQGVMAGKNANSFVVGIVGTLSGETISPYCDKIVNDFTEIDRENLIRILKER